MNKKFVKIIVYALFAALNFSSCRNVEPDNPQNAIASLPTNGKVNVQVNFLGTYFNSSIDAYSLADSKPQTFVRNIAGNTLVAELTPSVSPFSEIVKGENLPKDYPYRVFVFDQEDKIFVDYKDFKVGEEKPASFTLDSEGNYILIAYTDAIGKLPEFNAQEDLTLDDITVDFEGADVMYFKLENYSPSKIGNIVNIILMHKTSTITLDVKQILYKEYVKDVSITPNYMSGVLNLSTGEIVDRKESIEYKIADEYLTFNAPEGNVVSGQMPINVADTLMFGVKIKLNNEFEEFKFPFKLGLGTKYTLSLKLKYNCGAYVSKELWKEFMCHNLGANYDAHPINKITDLYGNKYQWGVKEPATTHEEDVNNASKTIVPVNTEIDAWRDDFKTENDPCPNGYRIPTIIDFEGMIEYNKWELLKTWNEKENYLMKFGEDLIMPIAGYRNSQSQNVLYPNLHGHYWVSIKSIGDRSKIFSFYRHNELYPGIRDIVRKEIYALPIRCCKEDDNITVRPDIPKVDTGWDKEENIEVDIDKVIKDKKKKGKK